MNGSQSDDEIPGSSAQISTGVGNSSGAPEALGPSGGFISAVDDNADTIALPEVWEFTTCLFACCNPFLASGAPWIPRKHTEDASVQGLKDIVTDAGQPSGPNTAGGGCEADGNTQAYAR